MVIPERARSRLIHYPFWAVLLFSALTGCIPEESFAPAPSAPALSDPLLPTLFCAPFILNGYSDKMSYQPGDTMHISFQSTEDVALCQITMYNMSGEPVFSSASKLPLVPELSADASENGFNYPVAASVVVPELKSGIYFVENKIPFIVKTAQDVDILVVYPSNTANAYATSGGKSLYSGKERPPSVSFQRPIALQSFSRYCLKWFTTLSDFSIGYIADIDMDHFESIAKAKVLVIPGHSEYWTRLARKNFDSFVNSGGDALILSGNTMWWQVRYSDDKQKLICYKDVQMDPVNDPLIKTIEWTSTSLEYSILSSIGAHFPYGGYGLRKDNGWDGYKIAAPTSPLFEGLGFKKGDTISLPSLEYDGSPISAYDEEGYPILDAEALNFSKIELLGFDKGFRVTETTATFIVFQKEPTTGIIVNTASTDWCSSNGMGGASGNEIKVITHNALKKLVHNEPVFSQ